LLGREGDFKEEKRRVFERKRIQKIDASEVWASKECSEIHYLRRYGTQEAGGNTILTEKKICYQMGKVGTPGGSLGKSGEMGR